MSDRAVVLQTWLKRNEEALSDWPRQNLDPGIPIATAAEPTSKNSDWWSSKVR